MNELTNKFVSSGVDSDNLHAMAVGWVPLEDSFQLRPDPQNGPGQDVVGTESATCLTVGSELAPPSPVPVAKPCSQKAYYASLHPC